MIFIISFCTLFLYFLRVCVCAPYNWILLLEQRRERQSFSLLHFFLFRGIDKLDAQTNVTHTFWNNCVFSTLLCALNIFWVKTLNIYQSIFQYFSSLLLCKCSVFLLLLWFSLFFYFFGALTMLSSAVCMYVYVSLICFNLFHWNDEATTLN